MTTITTLSTMQKSLNTRSLIADQDMNVQKARQEVTTGLKADIYGDGSFRAAQTLDLRNRMARSDAFATSNKLLGGKMSVMNGAMGNIRTGVQEFISMAIAFGGQSQGEETLRAQAQSLITRTSSYLNTVYAGEFLFSGTASADQSITIPQDGFEIDALAPNSDPDETADLIDAMDSYFGLSATASTGPTYSSQAYTGTDERQVAQINETIAMPYGISADDKSLRQIFKGLTMLAQTDISTLTNSASYKLWLDEAINALNLGVAGLQAAEIDLGNSETEVLRAVARQETLAELYNNRIVDIEGVDGYEAATRLEALSAQLEASYAVTVRLKSLTLLNYL